MILGDVARWQVHAELLFRLDCDDVWTNSAWEGDKFLLVMCDCQVESR